MVHPNFCKDTYFSWLEQKLAEEKIETRWMKNGV